MDIPSIAAILGAISKAIEITNRINSSDNSNGKG